MNVHITIYESEDPLRVPNCNDLLLLRDAVAAMRDRVLEEAQTGGSAGLWGARTSLETAVYYLHGAAAWMAKEEGLI